MFNVNSKPTFQTTVKVPALVEAGAEPPSFSATFRALSDEEAGKHNRLALAGIKSFLREAIVTLDDLVDGEKKPLPYTEALRDELLDHQYMRAALMGGYFDAVSGLKAGN